MNGFVLLFPLIAAYVAEAVKNLEREGQRPPGAEVNSLVWMVSCCLKAGVHLAGVGLFQCEISEIEALMNDRTKFRDTPFALALREAVRLVLRDFYDCPSGRNASVTAIKGLDLDLLATPKPTQPTLTLKPAHSPARLLLYELANSASGHDEFGASDGRKALISFLRKTYLGLPKTDRRIVGLRAIVRMSWDGIVKETGVPRASAHRRYHATLKRMADALDDWARRNGYGSRSRP